jgi:hypothetical protein
MVLAAMRMIVPSVRLPSGRTIGCKGD